MKLLYTLYALFQDVDHFEVVLGNGVVCTHTFIFVYILECSESIYLNLRFLLINFTVYPLVKVTQTTILAPVPLNILYCT